MAYYLEELPGNTFFLGIAFGLGEMASIFLYGFLMTHFGDINLLRCSYFILMSSIFTLLYGSATFSLVALLACVCTLGGFITLHYLVTELRVPPQNLGSVNLLSQCVGQLGSLIASFAVTLPGNLPLFICLGSATLYILMVNTLPKPGHHLPTVVEVVETGVEKPSTRNVRDDEPENEQSYLRYREVTHSKFVFDETLNQEDVLIETKEA